MIRIIQLKLSINHTPEELSQKIRKELRLKNEGFTYEIVKQSLDCRHKEDKKFVYTVDVSLQDKNQESKIFRRVHNNNIMLTQKKEYTFPSPGEEELKYPPVIVGSGPAGIFCAWYLAKAGYRPLVLERGEEAHVRQKTVENFWKNGVLDPDSNVQFGEGGAGTFSDGKLNTLVKDVTDNMDHFELGIAVQKVYDFIWDEFCDWYIEMVKPRLYSTDDAVSQNAALWTLKTVLIDALKLLHPYMPFITEEIFCTIQNEEESIMISKWPEYSEDRAFPAEEKAIETIKEAVRGIRNIRTEMNVAPSRKASVYVVSENDEIRRIFEEGKLFFASLAYANEIMIQADKTGIAEDAVSVVIPGATLYIPFAELVDIAQEIERLKKEQKRLEGELSRSRGMLSNERFLSKAPEAKIAEEKEKLAKYEQMMEQVTKRLEQLA